MIDLLTGTAINIDSIGREIPTQLIVSRKDPTRVA